MSIIVKRQNGEVGKVQIAHWWPQRDWDWTGYTHSPIPSHVRNRAYRMGTTYMTMARVMFPSGELATYALCCPKDQPTREAGRFISLLRMGRLLKSMGLRRERV